MCWKNQFLLLFLLFFLFPSVLLCVWSMCVFPTYVVSLITYLLPGSRSKFMQDFPQYALGRSWKVERVTSRNPKVKVTVEFYFEGWKMQLFAVPMSQRQNCRWRVHMEENMCKWRIYFLWEGDFSSKKTCVTAQRSIRNPNVMDVK